MITLLSARRGSALLAFGLLTHLSLPSQANTSDGLTTPWSLAPFIFASTRLQNGPTFAYQPWYENGTWQGDLIQHSVAVDGAISTDVISGQNPPHNGTINWSARAVMAEKEASIANYWQATDGRQIITFDGSTQVPFRWNELTAEQQIILDPLVADPDGDSSTPPPVSGAYASAVLNYIRGDRSGESATGLIRKRFSLLGDMQNSNPVYVGRPQAHPSAGFGNFAATHKNRAGRIYAGGNDGLLHAFDAATGAEVFAYAPSMLFSKLSELTRRPYVHTATVDGELTSSDVPVGSVWKTVLASGLGAGARGLFALDITSPGLTLETSTSSGNNKVLFEKSGSDSRLGHVFGRPRIAVLPDGNSYLISGNGFGSDGGHAMLYLINLQSSVVSTIGTGATGGNGLAAPAVIDVDGDGTADNAYAGDVLGNVWHFDLAANTSRLLFAAGASQPFTKAPDVTRHPSGGYMVFVASGTKHSISANGSVGPNTVYGLWDKPGLSSPIDNNNLQQQPLNTLGDWRFASRQAIDWTAQYGWKAVLSADGEQLRGNPKIRDGRLQFVTTGADDGAWFLQLDWLTGGDPQHPLFDINADGLLNSADMISFSGVKRVPAGQLLGSGVFSQPAYAHVAEGHDMVLINGIDLPTVQTCSGDCAGGLIGGHVDVDSDINLGGATDAHVHEYDEKYSVTYMDYFNLEAPSGGSLDHADEVGIDANADLVAIIANADLSPGGVISIGNKQWNVVDYQEMVQQELQQWDGTSALHDDDGDPLLFSLSDLQAINSSVRISFNDRAIANGGLHPTGSGCVKSQLTITNGRWRNGSLIIQLLLASELLPGASPNNAWVAQQPTDLPVGMLGGGLHANQSYPAGFVYESTLFWHHGGSCYGESNWEQSVIDAQADIFDAQYGHLFPDYANNASTIHGLLDQLANYQCTAGTDLLCKNESGYKSVEVQLNNLVGNYHALLDLLNPGTHTYTSGEPAEVSNAEKEYNPALGPNYKIGRRTWIDNRQ